jgi:hypothetical protein
VDLQLSAYRSIQEAVSLLLLHEPGQIKVRARTGCFQGRSGIVMTVAVLDLKRSLSACTIDDALERLSGRVLAYGGSVSCKGNRIRMVMVEPENDVVRWQHHA